MNIWNQFSTGNDNTEPTESAFDLHGMPTTTYSQRAILSKLADFVTKNLEKLQQRYSDTNYKVLIVSSSHLEHMTMHLEDILSQYEIEWYDSDTYISHEFKVYIFRTGIIKYHLRFNAIYHWGFTKGHRFRISDFSEENQYRECECTVWSNLSGMRFGSPKRSFLFVYYWGDRDIRQIVATLGDERENYTILDIVILTYEDNPWPGSREGITHHSYKTINVPPNQKVAKLSVFVDSDKVNGIKFYFTDKTNHNQILESEWIGEKIGTERSFNEQPKGIYGYYGNHIDSIGIFY